MVIEIERTRSLDVPFAPDQLYGAIYGGESKAHKFIITAMRDGTEATLSGTVTAKFLRADNVCVALTGTIEGGKACVVLGDECYATPGRFVLTIFVASGEENLCVYAAIGTTNRTDGTSTVDGGNIIPSVSDLIAQIDAAVATIPASYSDLMGSVAGTYSASNTYAVGDYVWYDGVLYRCTTAISTAESWTAAHWSRAVLGEDTSALKSAIVQNEDTIESLLSYNTVNLISGYNQGYYISASGVETAHASIWYGSATISSDLIGKEITIAGTAWYDVLPYVFVGTGSPITPDIPSAGSTLTQYTDLKFTPTEQGTLYVNKFDSGATHHTGTATFQEIASFKSDLLPQPLPVKDITEYETVTLTMNEGKLLNGLTGAVTDNSATIYRVSDLTEVDPSSKIMVSTSHYYGNGMYAFYDENQNYISGVNAASGATVTNMRCQIIDVPSTAKYIRIGYFYQQNNFPECALWQGVTASALPSAKWSGKKWTVIGDSLTAAYGVTNIHYWEYIKGATGVSVTSLGESGMGYAKGTNNFMVKGLLVPSDSDVVTIFGSGNDGTSGLDLGDWDDTGTATVAGCINTAIDNVFSINPIVPLGIITPTPWVNNMPSDGIFMENYANLIVEICKKRSIPCLDLYHCSNLNPNSSAVREAAYSKDPSNGVHPNEKGQLLIATHVKAFLETLLM